MILNDAGERMTSAPISGAPGDDKAFTLLIECRSGYELSATSPDAGVVIWGKANPGDAFQNIQTTPIDLTPFDGSIRDFYFECRIDAGEAAGQQMIFTIDVARG